MFSLFGFGKKRRTRKSTRKSTRRKSRKSGSRKPPARLLKICKKYRVKATRKVGGKRVYKSARLLAKACLKKAMKKARKARKGTRKVVRRRRVHRRSAMFGMNMMDKKMMGFGNMHMMDKKMMGFGNMHMMDKKMMGYGAMDMKKMMGEMPKRYSNTTMDKKPIKYSNFGKRRRTAGRKVSKSSAMKAFRAFYKRHCAGMRRSRFGSNPPLYTSMGYEFCPSGMGGVLGADSTGLFPSPCTGMNTKQAVTEATASMPSSSAPGLGSYSNAFGRRRRRTRSTAIGRRTRRKTRSTAIGRRTRRKTRSTAIGRRTRRKTRSTAIGRRRKTVRRKYCAIGSRRR